MTTEKIDKARILRNARILRIDANLHEESIRRGEIISVDILRTQQQFLRDVAADLEQACG